MKQIVTILTISASMMIATSCNTRPKTSEATTVISAPDTTGLSQFQQWKAKNELGPNQNLNNQSSGQPTKTIVKYVPVKTTRSTGSGTMNSESANTAKASQKRGMSKAAKGAVIGGVGGAAAGAVINKKNRGVGAVVGGVLGAGAGYGIGRSKDKKDGRY